MKAFLYFALLLGSRTLVNGQFGDDDEDSGSFDDSDAPSSIARSTRQYPTNYPSQQPYGGQYAQQQQQPYGQQYNPYGGSQYQGSSYQNPYANQPVNQYGNQYGNSGYNPYANQQQGRPQNPYPYAQQPRPQNPYGQNGGNYGYPPNQQQQQYPNYAQQPRPQPSPQYNYPAPRPSYTMPSQQNQGGYPYQAPPRPSYGQYNPPQQQPPRPTYQPQPKYNPPPQYSPPSYNPPPQYNPAPAPYSAPTAVAPAPAPYSPPAPTNAPVYQQPGAQSPAPTALGPTQTYNTAALPTNWGPPRAPFGTRNGVTTITGFDGLPTGICTTCGAQTIATTTESGLIGARAPFKTTCSDRSYVEYDVTNALVGGCYYLKKNQTIGGSEYPKPFDNSQGFQFGVIQGPYFEFPLLKDAGYVGGDTGADFAIFNRDCFLAGEITRDPNNKVHNGWGECTEEY